MLGERVLLGDEEEQNVGKRIPELGKRLQSSVFFFYFNLYQSSFLSFFVVDK